MLRPVGSLHLGNNRPVSQTLLLLLRLTKEGLRIVCLTSSQCLMQYQNREHLPAGLALVWGLESHFSSLPELSIHRLSLPCKVCCSSPVPGPDPVYVAPVTLPSLECLHLKRNLQHYLDPQSAQILPALC